MFQPLSNLFSQVTNVIIVQLKTYIKGWNVFVYYELKRLEFNKGWNVLGYLGVKNNDMNVGLTCIGYFTLRVEVYIGWSVNGLKRLATILSCIVVHMYEEVTHLCLHRNVVCLVFFHKKVHCSVLPYIREDKWYY